VQTQRLHHRAAADVVRQGKEVLERLVDKSYAFVGVEQQNAFDHAVEDRLLLGLGLGERGLLMLPGPAVPLCLFRSCSRALLNRRRHKKWSAASPRQAARVRAGQMLSMLLTAQRFGGTARITREIVKMWNR